MEVPVARRGRRHGSISSRISATSPNSSISSKSRHSENSHSSILIPSPGSSFNETAFDEWVESQERKFQSTQKARARLSTDKQPVKNGPPQAAEAAPNRETVDDINNVDSNVEVEMEIGSNLHTRHQQSLPIRVEHVLPSSFRESSTSREEPSVFSPSSEGEQRFPPKTFKLATVNGSEPTREPQGACEVPDKEFEPLELESRLDLKVSRLSIRSQTDSNESGSGERPPSSYGSSTSRQEPSVFSSSSENEQSSAPKKYKLVNHSGTEIVIEPREILQAPDDAKGNEIEPLELDSSISSQVSRVSRSQTDSDESGAEERPASSSRDLFNSVSSHSSEQGPAEKQPKRASQEKTAVQGNRRLRSQRSISSLGPKNLKKSKPVTLEAKASRKKSTKEVGRYVGISVWGNYDMLKSAQFKTILDKTVPVHGLQPEKVSQLNRKVNHYLEDFFQDLCDSTDQYHGFFTFHHLKEQLVNQKLITKDTTDVGLMRIMKELIPPDHWKKCEGIIYPARNTPPGIGTDYYLWW